MIAIDNLKIYFKKRRLHYSVLILFLIFASAVVNSTRPQSSIFEGNLIVSRLSFTFGGGKIFFDKSNGRKSSKKRFDQVFLSKAYPLEKIIIQGTGSFTLPPGKYASDTSSFLNINSKEPIKVDIQDAKNQIVIESSIENSTQLAVSELRLNSETNVTNLAYDSHKNRLYVLLKGVENSSPGSLFLDIGIDELKIKVNGKYNLPKFRKNGAKLDLRLKPSNSKLSIPLQESVWLELNLSKSNQNIPRIEFGQRFRVENLQLYTRTGDVEDATSISSIIEGQIQMPQTQKKLNLQSGQFLLSEASDINDPGKSIPNESDCLESAQPNIYMIRNIEANSKGIGFHIIGESKKLQSGFDPCFPVDWIQVSWLGKLFNQELHPALLTFFTGGATGLLIWIVSHFKEFLPSSNRNQ